MAENRITRSFICGWLMLLCFNCCYGQRAITVKMNAFTCYDNNLYQQYKADGISAFEILSKVFSSVEFQDSLAKADFDIAGYCGVCAMRGAADDRRIAGSHVLDVLFSRTEDSLDLDMQYHSGALGMTVPCEGLTTAYYQNIYTDMCHLPADVRLAINLCHEYMHHIGFCHFRKIDESALRLMVPGDKCRTEYYDPIAYRDDIAYRVGWIVYDILKRPYAKN